MIDKKPYRVTNEQVGRYSECSQECFGCENMFICPTGNKTQAINELASDLLDARDLIDKQEAIIKEFRKIGQEVINWNVSYIPLIELLEKTKEYI